MPFVVYCLLFWMLNATIIQAEEIRASYAMNSDPEFHTPARIKTFPKSFKPLFLQALARPEADLQRRTAETIAQAHEFGYPEMTEARPRLLEILTAKETDPTARFAAARALIVMETLDAAPALFEASRKSNPELRQLIEPSLGKWKYQPLGVVWRERLTASNVRFRDYLLAIDGVAQLQDQAAVPLLLKIVHDPLQSQPARLAAAKSAGTIQVVGLEPETTKLGMGQEISLINRLCALFLVINHDSDLAKKMLQQFALDREASIAGGALGRLMSINPDLVVPLADGAMNHVDPIVRSHGAEAYIARPDPERVVKLVRLLDDPHPKIRGRIREAVYSLTKSPEFDLVLRPAIVNVLHEESWRGQEQATLLLATLDHKDAALRMVELLESPRAEVYTTAAWGLRKLAVAATLPAMLNKAERQTVVREKDNAQPQSLDDQVVHLFEAMGLMNYAPAEPLFRKHIPKSFGYGQYSRAAAIWALGHMYKDRPDAMLVKQFSERMRDIASLPPETLEVQVSCAISLARMRAKSEIPAIRKLWGNSRSSLQPTPALRWALMQLTGETLPESEPQTYSKAAWFLSPLDNPIETK